jgi:hypothetical protein
MLTVRVGYCALVLEHVRQIYERLECSASDGRVPIIHSHMGKTGGKRTDIYTRHAKGRVHIWPSPITIPEKSRIGFVIYAKVAALQLHQKVGSEGVRITE